MGLARKRVYVRDLAIHRSYDRGQQQFASVTDERHLQWWRSCGFDYATGRIPGYNYLDLEATWNFTPIVQLRAGANNILDKDPPLLNAYSTAGGSAATYSVYDIFGRQVFVAFTAKF